MNRHPARNNEAGAALMEAALTLPILLVMAISIIDMGNWFFQHYTMSRVAYEGARFAAGNGELREAVAAALNDATTYDEINTVPCIRETLLNSGYPVSADYNLEGHFRVHSRMGVVAERTLANRNNAQIAAADAFSWSCYDEDTRRVVAQVSIPFQSVVLNTFNLNGWVHRMDMWPNVTARATAPHLFTN